jgi:hypothetical protein
MTSTLEYVAGAELPPALIQFLADDNSTVIDLTGATFVLKLALDTTTTALTKTSGINGSTTGATVNWSAGDLNLAAGTYVFELTATLGGLDYRRQGTMVIRPALA